MNRLTLQAEFYVRSSRDHRPAMSYYAGIERLNLPHLPRGTGILSPWKALAQLKKEGLLGPAEAKKLCPHFTGTAYWRQNALLADAADVQRRGIEQVMIVRGGAAVPWLSCRTLNVLRAMADDPALNRLEIAVAGQLPLTKGEIEKDLAYLARKREAGAQVVLTQPLWSPGQFKRYGDLLTAKADLRGMPIRLGVAIWPGVKTALRLRRYVEGMNVDETDLEKLRVASDQVKAGVGIAKEKIAMALAEDPNHQLFDGFMLFPFGPRGFEQLPEVVDFIYNPR